VDGHGAGNLIPLLIWGVFVIAAIRRWSRRRSPQMQPDVISKAAPGEPLARRRLAPAAPAAPIRVPQPKAPAASRAAIVPSMADTLPAEAAAAFPALDLSLPGTETASAAAPKRRIRTIGGGPPLGSPGWAANAVVAAEILGPPVSLRSGATLGAPHAF
jgi:hypothetical protein